MSLAPAPAICSRQSLSKLCPLADFAAFARVQVMGTLVKYGYGGTVSLPPERIYHVSVMPCFDKKLEAARDDFFNASAGSEGTRDVDCVLSAGEVAAQSPHS